MSVQNTIESLNFDAIRDGDKQATGDAIEFLWQVLNEEQRQRRRGLKQAQDRSEWLTNIEEPAAAVNDYDIANAGILRFDGATSVNLTGLLAPSGGMPRLVLVMVLGAGTITLKHNSASSEEPNRILTFSAGDVAIATNQSVLLNYQNSRWREVKLA